MGVLRQYEKFVKPSFDEYINPVRCALPCTKSWLTYRPPLSFPQTKKYADVIIPRGADNTVAIDLIVQHIKSQLNERDPKTNGAVPKRLWALE